MNNNIPTYNIGIDIGSTTFKLVVLDKDGNFIFSDYRRHNTDIKQAAKETLEALYAAIGDCHMNCTFTGSVGMGYAEKIGIAFVQEVVASAELIKRRYPEVHTFIDIGGEDSKMIFFEEGKVPDIRMNGNCAGGTGAFIDQTAALLEIDTIKLNELASTATNIYPIASRCGVFSKTDVQNLASRNISRNDIAASVFNAVAIQVVSSLAKGTDINPKIFMCGGPFAFLPELKKAFKHVLNIKEEDCIVPQDAKIIPAWGCALISSSHSRKSLCLSETLNMLRSNKNISLDNNISNRLPALFQSQADFEQWQASKVIHFVPRTTWEQMKSDKCYLGVDSGSTTTKLIVINLIVFIRSIVSNINYIYFNFSFFNSPFYNTLTFKAIKHFWK